MSSKESSASRAWQHVDGPSDEERKKNKYLNPGANPSPQKPNPFLDLDGFLLLENITCYDANDNVTEKYPKLFVSYDISRESDGSPIMFVQSQAIISCKSKGYFLPSSALTCAILVWLYEHKDNDPVVKAVLDQYKEYRPLDGWHAQNTVVNLKEGTILHYPGYLLNTETKTIQLDFFIGGGGVELESALRNKEREITIKNLTGLKDPRKLIEIGDYFGKPTQYLPRNPEDEFPPEDGLVCTFIGCGREYFSISNNNFPNEKGVARSVSTKLKPLRK